LSLPEAPAELAPTSLANRGESIEARREIDQLGVTSNNVTVGSVK
jgi:hypothetical protein